LSDRSPAATRKTQHLVLTISAELVGVRIDKALASVKEIASRSQAAKLLDAGAVTRTDNGRPVKASYVALAGDSFNIDVPTPESSTLEPYAFKLNIVYEDSELIVVNKPAGLVVHPAAGHAQDTLVNALIHHTDDLSMGFNEKRPGLVHRIDKGTSGLLVVAKNDEAQRRLAEQFHAKTTHRLYRAIAFGPFKSEHGEMRSFLQRHPEDRKRFASSPEGPGKLAVTHYDVLLTHASGLSLVELRLETGRTHQIRVHLSDKGHPIAGDAMYGGVKRAKNLRSIPIRHFIETMPRFALHAAELGFVHPTTGKTLIFRVGWPDDLIGLVNLCGFPHTFAGDPMETR
jgi:23S rRNA pseudouridine1911/1915/1917 synthase